VSMRRAAHLSGQTVAGSLLMPTAFISYSWDSDAHKEWVLHFASDLRSSGVKVLLDRWEVRLGDDVTQFMEQGVANADFVILVCTEAFATKANNRSSGVGCEYGAPESWCWRVWYPDLHAHLKNAYCTLPLRKVSSE
jgi:hypothetical protein